MNNVMLDLETMGTGSDVAIIAIGAVEFDPEEGILGREFYEKISLQSAVDAGGVMDPSTVIWWMKQSEEARALFYGRIGMHIVDALISFTRWIKMRTYVWGNGAAADNVWLRNAYRRLNLPVPWEYHYDKCFRTMRGHLPEVEITDSGVAHNALDDAKWQARYLMEALKEERYLKHHN